MPHNDSLLSRLMPGYRSPIASGLAGVCPRCGQGKLLRGFLKPAPSCSNCGLDFHAEETGDGPIAFVILIWGAIVMGVAFWAEFALNPPYWLFVVILIPVTTALHIFAYVCGLTNRPRVACGVSQAGLFGSFHASQ